ncbi:MAG: relaxase domain-containing protein [Gaiella sp.]|nr:relaxase domain-containing protein [Gaiella sp.]
MLAVSKLSPGQEAYYERSVADGTDDYYAGGGESPGVWAGRGAGELELVGTVGDGELGRLISGRHPLTGTLLRAQAPTKQTTIERIDPATGERYVEQKPLKPVAGYDLVFSPPKSVSLLHALGSEEVRHAVNQAHLAAWQATLAYLEERACVTRKGKNGRVRERGSGFVAAAYHHRTSRAQDPHLHTHVIVANMAKTPSDGEWRALDGAPILKTYRLAAGYLYQSQLRFELTRSLGVEWREPVKGMAEIAGVPDHALKAFSQRRVQVLDYLERHGSTGFYAAKVAAVETRDRKEPVDLPRLREEWRARAAEHDLGRRELKRLLGRAVEHHVDPRRVAEIAAHLAGPEGLTEKRSTFSGPDAVIAWAQANRQGAPVERVLALVRDFLSNDEVATVERATIGRPARYSTEELLRQERVAVKVATNTDARRVPTVAEETVAKAVAERKRPLSREQAAMVRAVAASPERVVCVVGHAGSGKTTALAALADTFRREGHVAIGAAPSGVAAANLAAETGLPSGTLHRLLAEAREHGGLPDRCLVVVDEAGMADTRTLSRLLWQAEHAHAKLVLVGDPAQLPAVGPGGLYAAIVERKGAIELSDNRRQRDELEGEALALLRAGRPRDYLAYAAEQGRLTVVHTRAEAKARLLVDWWRAASADPDRSVMIAYRRADVAELNSVARTLLDDQGRLGRRRLQLENGLELAVGDRILCTRNDRRLAVTNGSRGTIVDVDPKRRSVVVDLDDKRRVELPADYVDAGHVAYGYALTGHKTQGLTVERAFVLADYQRALKEWGYVALSRAREQTRLYTIEDCFDRDASPHRIEPAGPVDRLADALSRPAAELLALDATRGGTLLSDRARLTLETRQLDEWQKTLKQERLKAAHELHETRRKLETMGALARARHRRTLRETIGQREERVARLDRELDQVESRRRLNRERILELARSAPRPERGLSRERAISHSLERVRGLDPRNRAVTTSRYPCPGRSRAPARESGRARPRPP